MAEFEFSVSTTPSSSPALERSQHRRTFRTIFRKLLPAWLTDGEGGLVLYSLGLLEDAFAERAYQGLLARFPSYAPDEALPLIGRDRKIVRGIGEPRASYVSRLLGWLDVHPRRGNARALLEQIRTYCQAEVRVRTVDARGNWYTLERDGSFAYRLRGGNWNWDGKPPAPYWSRFWVIIYPTEDGRPWTYHEPGELWTLDQTTTIGTSATPAEVATLRGLIREWQPDGTRCEWIVIAFEDEAFDPDAVIEPPEPGTWGNWGRPTGGHLVASRLTTARYFAGSDGGRRGVVT